MRAAVITAHAAPASVRHQDEPTPADGEVLVEVRAAPITPLDVLCASGTSYFGAPPLPYVPGVQGVGVVRTGPCAGDRVWFATDAGMAPGDGSMAQVVAVREKELVPLPDDTVEDVHVAALGLSAVAAWMVLTWRAHLQRGEQVLVLGAGGTVGQVAVQTARLLGVRRVVGACRSTGAQERAAAAGADAVVPLSGDDPDTLAARLAEACDGPVDVVVDPLCGAPATAAARLLADGGRLVNLGSSAGPTMTVDSAMLRSRSAEVLGYTNNALTAAQRDRALLDVLDHASAGRIAVQHEVVPLEDVTSAWQRQVDGAVGGRVVVDLATRS